MATTKNQAHAQADNDELARRFTAATERACGLLDELLDEIRGLRKDIGEARRTLGEFGKQAGVAGVLGRLFGGR